MGCILLFTNLCICIYSMYNTASILVFLWSPHVWHTTWVMEQGLDSASPYPSTHGPVASDVVIFTPIDQYVWCLIHHQESMHPTVCWCTMLKDFHNLSLVQFILDGICQGFCIGFTKPQLSLKSARNNLEGAKKHPNVVSEYLQSEVLMGRVVDPFSLRVIPHLHINWFGWSPKDTQIGGD